MVFVTARKLSLRRLCFYTCLAFCSQGDLRPDPGGRLGLAREGVSRPRPRGEVGRGLAGGVSRPTPGGRGAWGVQAQGEVGGYKQGRSMPRPGGGGRLGRLAGRGVQAHTWGRGLGVSRPTPGECPGPGVYPSMH